MRRAATLIVKVVGVLLLLAAAGAAILASLNHRLPDHSALVDRLSEAEKARLAEVFHLRQQVGQVVWPGWEQADIPLIVYNETYAFLLGLPNPADGWRTVPQNEPRGGPWELVAGETFLGQPYYRQRLADGVTPQAFTVRVGDQWAASLQTKEWLEIALRLQLADELPPLLAEVVPYGWFVPALVGHSEGYITKVSHETFHAYQGQMAPARLDNAETALRLYTDRYPWEDEAFAAAWQQELALLAAALEAESPADRIELTRRFLDQRDQRRLQYGLPAAGEIFERQREWLEGLAKYVELAAWRQAAQSPAYQPTAALAADPDFRGYGTFAGRWRSEISTLRQQADRQGDSRFYYSGMAQAFLLDELMPEWKGRIMSGGVWLEGLLAEAVRE